MEALRHRLNLFDIDEVSFDDVIVTVEASEITYADIVAAPANLEVQVSAQILAEDVFEMLTDRQRNILHVYLTLPKPTLDQISAETHVSKSTVHHELKVIESQIAPQLSIDESEMFITKLSELCSKHAEHLNEVNHGTPSQLFTEDKESE
jgi:predicted DNA-binding protein YlxM (UPF0122 family)